MAIDWGDIVGGALGDIAGQLVGTSGPFPGPTFTGPGTVPTEVTYNTQTGQIKPCRRRRRRRLLTPTDLSDLAALATIVGKGDSLKLAVVKAVRR